jgi:hypothetical protein
MAVRLIGILGLSTTIFFFFGFIGLFIIHPVTYSEINNIGISFLNLDGMKGKTWISLYYILVGLLNILFVVGLFEISENRSVLLVGKILLLVTALTWISFGLIDFKIETDFDKNLLFIRSSVPLITAMPGLSMLGGELEQIVKDKFLKYYTLLSGAIILIIGITALEDVAEDWIRSNISWTIYFLWFGVCGMRFLFKKRTSAIPH